MNTPVDMLFYVFDDILCIGLAECMPTETKDYRGEITVEKDQLPKGVVRLIERKTVQWNGKVLVSIRNTPARDIESAVTGFFVIALSQEGIERARESHVMAGCRSGGMFMSLKIFPTKLAMHSFAQGAHKRLGFKITFAQKEEHPN